MSTPARELTGKPLADKLMKMPLDWLIDYFSTAPITEAQSEEMYERLMHFQGEINREDAIVDIRTVLAMAEKLIRAADTGDDRSAIAMAIDRAQTAATSFHAN